VRIINDQQISTFTRYTTTNTDSEVLAVLVGTPAACGFRVASKSDIREYSLVILTAHKVTNLSTKANS